MTLNKLLMVWLTIAGAGFCAAQGNSGYVMTIYVDTHSNSGTGHAYVGLKGPNREIVRGFYPPARLRRMGGAGYVVGGFPSGEVRDDSKYVRRADVFRGYEISKERFRNALIAIQAWTRKDEQWSRKNHCGDFVSSIALSAGVPLGKELQEFFKEKPAVDGTMAARAGARVAPTPTTPAHIAMYLRQLEKKGKGSASGRQRRSQPSGQQQTNKQERDRGH